MARAYSAVGMRYCDGVIIAADNLVEVNNMKKYHDVQRVFKINDQLIIGGSGDFQHIQSIVEQLQERQAQNDIEQRDPRRPLLMLKPSEVLNKYRDEFSRKRLNNLEVIVGGMEQGKPLLGRVDGRGTMIIENVVATPDTAPITMPILFETMGDRNWDEISQDRAIGAIHKCMEILFYNHTMAISEYTLAVCTKESCKILGPISISQNWQHA